MYNMYISISYIVYMLLSVTRVCMREELYKRKRDKHTKYDDLASKLECRVVAAAFTTYGGWGDDFKKTLVDPYYKKEFKAARKNGESGWAVINDRLRYERHVSAVICRENSRMLGLTLDARCRARAIQRSAPQRSPVADSDTDP